MSGAESFIIERDAPMMSFESFVESVRRASEVHTDRLHCMIMALLLGKQTFAYATAYSKLEGVYEHSIKSWADVTFVRDEE
jgi:exopolysaccharide biosynthesis predicted pyruvyltransferase EpsI